MTDEPGLLTSGRHQFPGDFQQADYLPHKPGVIKAVCDPVVEGETRQPDQDISHLNDFSLADPNLLDHPRHRGRNFNRNTALAEKEYTINPILLPSTASYIFS